MTQSLSARLQERLEKQTAEIEALNQLELERLSKNMSHNAHAALGRIESAIDRSTRGIMDSIPRLKWIIGLTWVALIASLSLTGFLLWRSATMETPDNATFPTFTHESQSYVILPPGSEMLSCTSRGQEIPCVKLPSPQRN